MNAAIITDSSKPVLTRAKSTACAVFFLIGCAALSGCNGYLGSMFTRSDVRTAATENIQIVDVTDAVTRELMARHSLHMFSDVFGTEPAKAQVIGAGDTVQVSIWEAPPAVLFGTAPMVVGSSGASPVTTLPEQMVSQDGYISVPFAGQIKAAGNSVPEVENEITDRLKGKANQPQIMVRVIHNVSSNVTVVGEVDKSALVPITARGEKLLDALAAAGGVRQPVNKMTIQLTRGGKVQALPLDAIIKDPKQNVPLQPGDVVTALFQPLSFTALGATGKNEEVNFETQGITLAQALARSGGLLEPRSDAKGVFIFRFEDRDAIQWPQQLVATTPDGKVPVIYRIDLQDPATLFVAQNFPINNKDILYVSNAPAYQTQKFLNLVFSIVYPLTNAAAATK